VAYGLWSLMPPFETRHKPEPDVWLDDALWTDTRRTRSRESGAATAVAVEITVSTGVAVTAEPPFYDLEREADAPDPASRPGAEAAPQEHDGPRITDRRAPGAGAPAARAPFTPAAPAGDVPGLLRRPLVEVQATPPERGVDRPRLQRPDVLAIVAITLALIVLISAVIASQG